MGCEDRVAMIHRMVYVRCGCVNSGTAARPCIRIKAKQSRAYETLRDHWQCSAQTLYDRDTPLTAPTPLTCPQVGVYTPKHPKVPTSQAQSPLRLAAAPLASAGCTSHVNDRHPPPHLVAG
jgi:hypothetical protein